MPIKMGPALSFNGIEQGVWKLSAVIVTDDEPPGLTWNAPRPSTAQPELLWQINKRKVYRYRFSMPLQPAPATFTYAIDGQSYDVAVPAAGQSPRMAYASCNGFSSPKYMKGIDNKNAVWEKMKAKHAEEPYQLLLFGGDQVYANSIGIPRKRSAPGTGSTRTKATRSGSPPRCNPKPNDFT